MGRGEKRGRKREWKGKREHIGGIVWKMDDGKGVGRKRNGLMWKGVDRARREGLSFRN